VEQNVRMRSFDCSLVTSYSPGELIFPCEIVIAVIDYFGVRTVYVLSRS
jgi:hypothetical protein